MPPPKTAPLSALIEAHGVAFDVRAAPADGPDAITDDGFQRYVAKLTRMIAGLSRDEVEMLRDELLIVDALGDGVALSAFSQYHPLSASAASAGRDRDAAQIRIRGLDPFLRPKFPSA